MIVDINLTHFTGSVDAEVSVHEAIIGWPMLAIIDSGTHRTLRLSMSSVLLERVGEAINRHLARTAPQRRGARSVSPVSREARRRMSESAKQGWELRRRRQSRTGRPR